MSQHPDGGERAHLDVEPGLAGNHAKAAHERPYELVPRQNPIRLPRRPLSGIARGLMAASRR